MCRDIPWVSPQHIAMERKGASSGISTTAAQSLRAKRTPQEQSSNAPVNLPRLARPFADPHSKAAWGCNSLRREGRVGREGRTDGRSVDTAEIERRSPSELSEHTGTGNLVEAVAVVRTARQSPHAQSPHASQRQRKEEDKRNIPSCRIVNLEGKCESSASLIARKSAHDTSWQASWLSARPTNASPTHAASPSTDPTTRTAPCGRTQPYRTLPGIRQSHPCLSRSSVHWPLRLPSQSPLLRRPVAPPRTHDAASVKTPTQPRLTTKPKRTI